MREINLDWWLSFWKQTWEKTALNLIEYIGEDIEKFMRIVIVISCSSKNTVLDCQLFTWLLQKKLTFTREATSRILLVAYRICFVSLLSAHISQIRRRLMTSLPTRCLERNSVPSQNYITLSQFPWELHMYLPSIPLLLLEVCLKSSNLSYHNG